MRKNFGIRCTNVVNASRRHYGFTIVELLVVCALIALLATLILPALVRAKGAARNIKCLSNLRQIGMGTLLYVNDFGAYPCGASASTRWSTVSWAEQIRKYTLATWTNDLYRCPDNFVPRRLSGGLSGTLDGAGTSAAEFLPSERDYDYNDAGVGGYGLGWSSSQNGLSQPVRESMVSSPSQMLAFGDSILPASAMRPASDSYFSPFAAGGQGVFRERERAQAKRHLSLFNVFYTDGHLERLATNALFRFSREPMRQWNRDNEPHPESWP